LSLVTDVNKVNGINLETRLQARLVGFTEGYEQAAHNLSSRQHTRCDRNTNTSTEN